MKDVKHYHQDHHQKRIEPVEKNLVLQQNSGVALKVLNDLNHASDKDGQAHEVDIEHVLFERCLFEKYTRRRAQDLLGGFGTRKESISHWLVVDKAVMEGSGNEDEDDEADQVYEETGDDDVLTGVQGVIRALGRDDGT
jgi:hypothetical protein